MIRRRDFPTRRHTRPALSLMELMITLVILGILAAMIVPRFGSHGNDAKKNACRVNKENINIQCQLWYRNKGAWPATNLSDISANTSYFPEGVPKCPVDASTYTFDVTLGQVSGHSH